MEKALAIQRQVIEILGTNDVYLVGGSVRDLIMGREPKDYDFTTPMLPDDMEAAVKKAGRRVYAIGKKFGTIGFKVAYKHNEVRGDGILEQQTEFEYVEVTTFRSEVYTNKSRKPEVQFVPSLEEDLARRDFTMNAMVLRPDGSIYDPYHGRLDIHAKKIVTVGLPKDRIIEDPLRIFRAARFAARYNFEIDPNFIGKARQLADRVFDVSVERWVQELDKLLTSQATGNGLVALHDMVVLPRILPEVGLVLWLDLFDDPDAAWKYLLSYTNILAYPQALKDNTRAQRFANAGICARFKFSKDRTAIIVGKH